MHAMELKSKLQGLAEASLSGLKTVLGGLQGLAEIGITEVPDVMEALTIAIELAHQINAADFHTVRHNEGHESIEFRSSPLSGPVVAQLQNATSVAAVGRPEQGYANVRVNDLGIEGLARTEILYATDYEKELFKICSQDAAEDKVTFFFVKADRIRTSTEPKLPHFQELLKRGWLEKRTFSPGELYRGEWAAEFIAVSHRWEDAKDPDPDGTQFKRIQAFMKENPPGKIANLVWLDFWCAPQGRNRKPAEWKYFQWVLKCMDMLYLGGTVLLLVDMSYMSRFWTEFEAWLSMQACSHTGLRPLKSNARRSHIECIHNATGAEERKLREMWERKTPSEAHDVLKAPDVAVTNKSDKDSKLVLIQEINTEVPKHFTRECAEKLIRDKEKKVRELELMGFSEKALSDTAKQLGFSARQLKEAGFSTGQLKEAGFSAGGLKEGGFAARQLKEGGFSARQLNEGGFSAAQLKEAGFSAEHLREGGLSAEQLNAAGFSAGQLKEAGFSTRQLKDAGFSARQLRPEGFSAGQLKESGFSARQLDEGGFSAGQLREGGFAAGQLWELGFSARRLREGGFSAKQLWELKFSVEQLKEAGFSAGLFNEGGFSASQLKEGGFSARQLKEGGFSAGQLKAAFFSVGQLEEGGFSAEQLREGGLSVGQLKEGGFSAGQLNEGGFSGRQLREGGFSAGQLKEGGFSARQLRELGLSFGQLREGGFSAWHLMECMWSAGELGRR